MANGSYTIHCQILALIFNLFSAYYKVLIGEADEDDHNIKSPVVLGSIKSHPSKPSRVVRSDPRNEALYISGLVSRLCP